MDDLESDKAIRLDKWLWAARFFKTRSLAAAAVTGGKISINGDRPKPNRIVRPGDLLTIAVGPTNGRSLSKLSRVYAARLRWRSSSTTRPKKVSAGVKPLSPG
jgi:ribosomal 50S subunit-recycling heat shock protein